MEHTESHHILQTGNTAILRQAQLPEEAYFGQLGHMEMESASEKASPAVPDMCTPSIKLFTSLNDGRRPEVSFDHTCWSACVRTSTHNYTQP